MKRDAYIGHSAYQPSDLIEELAATAIELLQSPILRPNWLVEQATAAAIATVLSFVFVLTAAVLD